MTEQPAAIVAGGGIAGLAAAVALAQAGWRVTVLERAAGFGEVGAGLGLTTNGMAAAEALGLGDAVRAAGHRTVTAGFQDLAGRWVVHVPAPRDGRDTATTIWGQHRQRLHAVLYQAATANPGTELVPSRWPGSAPTSVPAGGRPSATGCCGWPRPASWSGPVRLSRAGPRPNPAPALTRRPP
jgi:phytoene dehydrogenase-like protein